MIKIKYTNMEEKKMAEHYGTIPKKFTKAWWEYFWDYYKIHTIVIAVIIIAAAVTIYQVVTQTKYDYHITYAAGMYIDTDKLSDVIKPYVDDIDKNGEKNIEYQEMIFTENDQDAEFLAAMVTKLQLQFVSDECMLFIFDEDKAKYLFYNDSLEGAFKPVADWAETDIKDESRLYISDNVGYAVSLSDSKLLKDAGIDGTNLYVAVRNYITDEDDVLENMNTAAKIANELIK